jgi:hypothetical protein
MAASVRLDAPSLRKIAETWTLAVLTLMNSRSPICRLVRPSAIRSRTCCSLAVSSTEPA